MHHCTIFGVALGLLLGAARPAAAQTPDGQALYRQHCRSCHGLKGVPPRALLSVYSGLVSFTDSLFAATASEQEIVSVLENGSGKDMKSFRDKLTKEEMVAVAAYVRTLADPAAASP